MQEIILFNRRYIDTLQQGVKYVWFVITLAALEKKAGAKQGHMFNQRSHRAMNIRKADLFS